MTTHWQRRLVTIITEAALERELCELIERVGCSGFTVTEARGKGSRGVRDAGWATSGNIRVEVICSREIAEGLVSNLRQHYYENYAMVVFETPVEVLRDNKFT